jgi:hypothetical protein
MTDIQITQRPEQGTWWEDKDGTWHPALYVDDGHAVSTHSMIKTFRRCPKQAEFKYVYRLKPRLLGTPLKRGTWVHLLLEELHKGGDWRALHAKLSAEFDNLFDEERDFYGDMPTEIGHLMESYEWHYALDPWKVLETEFTLECEWPDGSIYRGKVDMLVETQFGLFLVDHKSHKSLPKSGFRLLDGQSALYSYAALKNKIPVQGFIWNYIKWKAPTIPKLVYKDTRLSRTSIETDYPTYTKALKKYKAEYPDTFRITSDYVEMQKRLKAQQYRHGEPQNSPFFLRSVLERDVDMLKRVAREHYHTSKRMNEYDFSPGAPVERIIERGCEFMCSYTDICTVELLGGNINPLVKQNYTIGDPMEYYRDRAGEVEEMVLEKTRRKLNR